MGADPEAVPQHCVGWAGHACSTRSLFSVGLNVCELCSKLPFSVPGVGNLSLICKLVGGWGGAMGVGSRWRKQRENAVL